MADQSANQSVWPHLIVGYLAVAGLVVYASGAPATAGGVGLVGAVLGYVLHNWQRPQARCWWPRLLGGCGNSEATKGKYYKFKRPCPLHRSTSYYVRPLARMFGWGGPKERKDK